MWWSLAGVQAVRFDLAGRNGGLSAWRCAKFGVWVWGCFLPVLGWNVRGLRGGGLLCSLGGRWCVFVGVGFVGCGCSLFVSEDREVVF